jgi:hypothetical protein
MLVSREEMTAERRSKWFFLAAAAVSTSGVFFQAGSRASRSGVAARP